MLFYRRGPPGWLHEQHSGRWNKAVWPGSIASIRWLNQAIKKASLTDAVLPLRSAFHQSQGRMKYASAEGNVPYLCPSGDKFIGHSTIYNPSEPWWSGLCYLSCAGTAALMIALLWGANKGGTVKSEEWDYKNICFMCEVLYRSTWATALGDHDMIKVN